MPLRADQILALFPNPVLSPILGEPDYAAIRILQKQTFQNLSAIPSNLGCGTKGLLWLATTPTVYATISATPVTAPTNPGSEPDPIAVAGAISAKEVTAIHSTYDLAVKLYEEYMAADRLSVKLLTAAVEDIFTASICDEITGYSSLTTRDFFDHLLTEYNEIDDPALSENQKKLGAPYDANLPIETLWSVITECVAYAVAGSSPFTDKQIITAAITALSASGVFLDDIKKWNDLSATDRDTYLKLKTYFSKAHRSWRKSLRPTAGAHFPRVNAAPTAPTFEMPGTYVQPDLTSFSGNLSDSLANLATATSADRATVATLTDTVAKLSAELASAQTKLISALMENQRLLKLVGGRGSRTPGGAGTPTSGGDPWTGPLIHYCFKHGHKCPHPSFKCPDPNSNHIKNATKKDTRGGCETDYEKK